MLELFLARKADSEPGYPAYTARRRAWFAEYGEERFYQSAVDAQQDPGHHFSQIAVADGQLAGFTRAEAPTGKIHTNWQGLTVATEYEHQHIGRRLESTRIAWAGQIGRPVVSSVVDENYRPYRLLCWEGFVPVWHHRESPDSPLFITLVLGAIQLQQLIHNPPRLPVSTAYTSRATRDYFIELLQKDRLI
jgi:GNAT superfamily N-acetyltransferase